MADVYTDPNGVSYIYVEGEWHAAPVVTGGATGNGGQAAVDAVTAPDGNSAGPNDPAAADPWAGIKGWTNWLDQMTGLSGNTPWLLIAAGVVGVVLASGRRRRR